MTDTPLLNEQALQDASQTYSPPTDVNLPNLPYKGFDTSLLPSEGGNPTPSALSALENKLFSISSGGDGKITGGSIPRSLKEVSSNRFDQYVPGDYNNEDAYALGQGWPSKMVNAVGKGLSLTGTTFLQSTAGTVIGLGKALTDGRAASFYDNEFNRALDEFNKNLENTLPNYYTDGEKNANWYSPKKLLTANFLWDGIIKNMGFAAGAYLSGGVYASGLKSLSALPGMAKLFSVGKAGETLAATEEALMAADKAAETYGKVESLSNKFLGTYNTLNKGQRVLVAGLATTGEAGFEAYYNLNDFRNTKIQEYKDSHDGWGPIGSDLDAINAASDGVGNSSFLLNTALLTATNYIQFPKILGSSDKAERSLIASTTTKEIGDITKDATGKFIKQEASTRTGRILSSINGIRPYTFSTSEGFEEGAQYAISQGTNDYYNKKYDNKSTDWLESLFQGAKQTIGTNEGMENVLIGGLSGALMLGRGKFQENRQIKANTADAIAKFNGYNLSDFTKATVDAVNRGTVLQEEREASLRRGDVLEAKDKEQDYIINYLSPRIKYGRFDLVQSDINEYKHLASTNEGFSQLQADGKVLQGDSRLAYLQRLSNLEEVAKHVKGLYESLQIRYGNLVKDGKPVYSPEVIDKMVYAASKVADYDKRIPQIANSLALKGVVTSDVINDVAKGRSEKYNEALSQIESFDINDDEKEELVRDLDDISELALRRQSFLKDYNDIKKTPESYKDVQIPTATPGVEPEKILVKTKDGEEEVIVGEEYFLGKTVEYDKSGKEVYRFPRITILGENEDGTIKVSDGKGNVKNVSKAVLEDYKLGKVSDTVNNKKAKFYMDNINSIFEFNFGKGKKQKGRLEYSSKDKTLNFVYKDAKGRIKSIEVTGDQFVPKKGYSLPMISKVGELSPAQQKSLDEFSTEQDNRITEKRTGRLKILTELFDEVSKRHEKTKELISEKQAQLENITKDLSALQDKIKDSQFTKKNRFKASSRRALEAAMKLSRLQDQIKEEISALEAERDETELNSAYIADLAQNIDELPTNTKDFLEELKEQRNNLESLILETGKEINTLSKLVDGVKGALDSAVAYLRDIISDFKTLYPKAPLAIGQEWVDFLKSNPNFLKKNPDYKDMLSKVEELVSQVEDLDITPNERTLNELVTELKGLQTKLSDAEKELKAKDLILAKFQEVADKFIRQKEEEEKIKNSKKLQKEILGSADPGVQTVNSESSYEPKPKKTDVAVVTSTKPAGSSTLPHHIRSNKFGANLDSFPNRQKIKGVLLTSKNEEELGLKGLTNFLKGDSDADASKIIALVMVENGVPVGEDGKKLEFPSFDNIIVQVMPDPKLEWSKEFGGGTMFRKDTTPEQIEYYKMRYAEWVKNALEKPSLNEHPVSASFGIPEYVTNLDEKGNNKRDYTAKTSVEEAGLIKSSDLSEKPVIFIPTTDTTVEKGSVSFTSPLGRPFLNLPNGYVKLDNRKLTKNEVNTIYEAIHQLAIDIFNNQDAQSEQSKRLMNWLKSIIYWGSPKNAAGFNSVWFSTINGEFSLSISGKDKTYPFTPSSIEGSKEEIISLLEGMYNNINSGLTDKPELWNTPYEEITSISREGVIEAKSWPNYQTYLLSKEGRKSSELPLSTNMKPVGEGAVNRHGIYFTLTDSADNYENAPKKAVVAPSAKKEVSQKGYILDGKTVNTYTSPEGKNINFKATSEGKITILTGGDVEEIRKSLTEKYDKDVAKASIEGKIKQAIAPQITEEKAPKKSIFNKSTETPSPERKPAIITTSPIEEKMEWSIDDLDGEEVALRVKLEEPLKYFEPENWEEMQKWLKANFPNLPVYRVKNVIQATNGQQAWGMLKNGAIYISKDAELGTIYHEVFEAVWKMFSDPQEQANVIKEFKDREGSFVDRPTGKTVNYSEATDFQIKEQLAEEFRDYVLNKKSPPKAKNTHFIIKLFRDLVDFIKSFFTGNTAVSNTDKLFDKIGRGYYKQFIPHEQQLSFAKEGFIDVEQAYTDNFSEFRIKNIPADKVNDIMQHMTYLTLTDLIKDNKSLFSIPDIHKKELYDRLKTRFTKIAEQSGEWDELVKKHQEYLKTYSIEFDENDDLVLKDEDASKKGDYQEATKIDVFKKANSAVKLLLSTIPIVDSKNHLVRSSIGGVRLLPSSQVFMAIMNNVHTSRSIDEMMDRIKEMSEDDNNYKTLYNRLTKNTSDLSEISEVHDGQLLAAFWRTFKKQSPDVKNVYIFDNGDVEVGDSNLSSAARQVSADYGNSIIKTVKSKNPYFEYSNKEKAYIGKPSGVKSVSLSTDQNRINFLKSLGIEFKTSELSKLSADKKQSFIEAVAGIKKSIQEAEKIATVSRKVLNIKGRLMQLSLIRASIDNPEFDSTFFNVKGERTQTFIGTNPTSDLFDVLSQINNKNELVNTPYEYLLTDSFAQGSVILDKIFNPVTGNRIKGGEQLMHPGYADGTVNTSNGKKKQSAKLTYKERLVQEINLNSKGYYYNLVPGDASMEWMTYMGNHISSDSLLSGMSKVHDIFKGYFLSELELSREDRPVAKKRDSEDLRFLKSILGEELQKSILKEKLSTEEVYAKYQSQINKAVDAFIKQETVNLRELLSKYDIIKKDSEGIKVQNLSFSDGEVITEPVLNRQLSAITINYIVNNIEFHKLLYSDPYQYSDELKRIKNALSPRQAIINNSPNFNKALNKIWNKGYDKGDVGYTDMTRDYFRTVTSEDVVSTSDLKDYGNFEETDGGGIISHKAYRWFRIKAGEWNDDEEKQYRYDIAYEKDIKGIDLSKEERTLLDGINPEVKSAYTPIKPIVFGNKLNGKPYNDVVLDKFALYPLSFRIVHSLNPESNAIKHYNKMQKENIDYTVFASGRKVGSEGLNPIYNEDGTFNESPYEALVNVSHGIISIQSEVPSKDEPLVTRGSQITKLVTMDYMEAGVPVDFSKGANFTQRLNEWNKLSETQKLAKSELYKEIKNNQHLLEAIIDNGYNSLLTKMGIEQTKDGDFIIKDFDKVSDTLRDEVLKREVNDNIVDAFEGFKNGDVVLEATPAYQQIRNILYSIADRNVISPKISGGQKVQIPSTLLESVKAKKEKGAYTSDFLRFYKDEDGKRTCEIMVGRWFNSPLSDSELLNYLNKTKEGQSLLSGVAYRIPTQKQNSIDSFVIKQFLPKEFGDSVVIPSELVRKVGSDFDIDKLFIYFKNTYTSLKGNIKQIPFYGYGEAAKAKLGELYDQGEFLKKEDRNRVNNWIKTRALDERQDVVNKLATAIFGQGAFDQEVIDDFLEANSDENLKERIVNQIYKKSLENEYIQSLQNLISHPDNFENLVKPNSADQLKALAKDITKKLGFAEFTYDDPKNMLNRHFMSRLRQAFVSGKYAIGIAAVNQTNHSLNQRQPIYIDQERWGLVSEEDKFWLSGGTFKKEDVAIKFKNYNKIDVNDKSVPTLSMIKNAKGENISDIIGQFIDGYVDISKGPWIMELGASPNVASTWLFLVKLGVPIKDVAYFMNQPIIRDYLDSIENAGYVWLFIEDFVEDIKDSPKYKVAPSEFNKIKEIPSNLGETVGKEKLSPQEKAQQQFILNEFLKYAKMANHQFLVTQGANWDTANFNDPYLVFKKNEQFKKAQSTIISSVNDLVKGSFIGKLSEKIYDVRDAFSTILTSDKPNVREVIEDVLRPYVDMNDRDFVKLAQKAVNDLFDWAVQNDRKLNNQIQKILLSDDNTAKEVSDFVTKVRKDENHPLYNNQIVKLVTPHFSEKNEGVNNLKIKNKDNKVYDQNQMIYAFSELRQYLKVQDSPLYGSLVRLAVLQSGLSNSPISFTSLLPYEDFKNIYNKTLSILEEYPNLADFKVLDVFQRNNWNNDDLVPQRKAKWKQNKNGEWKYNNNMKFIGYKRVSAAIAKKEIPQLVKINTKSREAENDVIVYTWETGTKAEKDKLKKQGDYSYIKRGLFKKVKQYGTPYTIDFSIGDTLISDYVYKAINAWGDSHSSDGVYFSANEFYNVAKPSIIDNGFIKVEKEASDESILSYFESPTKEVVEDEDDSNSNLPNCS
jgi:hypothetical protein